MFSLLQNLEISNTIRNFARKAQSTVDDTRYPILDEEESVDMASEPSVDYSTKIAVPVVEFKYPDGYDGFYTEDPDEFETYKSELIAEAMNDGIGCTWNEVRQQIRDRHPWLR